MNINEYTLIGELKNANSGFSKWGFATKNGKEYFIKELIKPVYPTDRSIMSEELFQQRRDFCHQYEEKFRGYFSRINSASRGNLVRIIEFFRHGGKYYLITEKVVGNLLSMEELAMLNNDRKLLLLRSVSYCFHYLHSAGVVHFDVKPANILVKRTINSNFAAKVIDFDSGFLKGEILTDDELGGDLAYLAPETFLALCGEDVHPDEKADIFALGLIFHEYYSGELPPYNQEEYDYPYEAALDNGCLEPDRSKIPPEIADLIASMLDAKPENRPSAGDIIQKLNEFGHIEIPVETLEVTGTDAKSIDTTSAEDSTSSGSTDWFAPAGDL